MCFPQLILLSSLALALMVLADERVIPVPTTSEVPLDTFADMELSPIPTDKQVETTPEGTIATTVKAVYSGIIDLKKLSPGLFGEIFSNFLGFDYGTESDGVDDSEEYEMMAASDDYDYIPLYGDDGYLLRSLPERPSGNPPCAALGFLDQMIWDHQGDCGQKLPIVSSQMSLNEDNTAKAPEESMENESKSKRADIPESDIKA